MRELLKRTTQIYYYDDFVLLKGDCLEQLKKIKQNSVDMIFVDPPYFLSNNGITCQNGKMVSFNKGKWDKSSSLDDIHNFNCKLLRLCKKVLK